MLVPGLAAGQSLGDAARKETDRRRRNQDAGVKAPVFTDDSLPSPGASPLPAATPEPPRPGADVIARGGRSESGARLEKEQYWRSRWAAALQQRDAAKQRYESLNTMWLAPGESYVDDQGRTVVRDLEELRRMVAEAKAAWQAAEKALADVEEDGRRAGALPGWFR
jgi:hypothetical protein